MSHSYRAMLSTPGAMMLMLGSFIARLPQAMINIGLITLLVQHQGRYEVAGAVAAIFTLANALLSPQVSKYVDRYSQHRILPIVTGFSVVMLLVLLFVIHRSMPLAWYFIFAALSGAMPNMTAMARARWTALFRGSELLHTAFSLDSVLTEFTYVIGPPLAIGLCTGLFPEAGPLAAIILLLIGMILFLSQRQTEPQTNQYESHRGHSTLNNPGLWVIILVFLAMGVIGGSIDVIVVAFANAEHLPDAASLILAAYALGSMISGLIFGTLRIKLPLEKQFLYGVIITALTIVLPAISSNVYIMTATIFIAGMSFAPTMVIAMNLGTAVLPQNKITEGLTWISTGISIGVALGGAISGRIIDGSGVKVGFSIPILSGGVMVIIAFVGLRTLQLQANKQVQPQEQKIEGI